MVSRASEEAASSIVAPPSSSNVMTSGASPSPPTSSVLSDEAVCLTPATPRASVRSSASPCWTNSTSCTHRAYPGRRGQESLSVATSPETTRSLTGNTPRRCLKDRRDTNVAASPPSTNQMGMPRAARMIQIMSRASDKQLPVGQSVMSASAHHAGGSSCADIGGPCVFDSPTTGHA
jgi:hypothetical protein